MTIRILVIDDELGRLEYRQREFLARWTLLPEGTYSPSVEFTFTTSQRTEDDRIVNDASAAVSTVARNPDSWALVLLDMQFDHGSIVNGEPVDAEPLFGLKIQAALEREFPKLPVVQFTAQPQKSLTRHDGVYLSKADGTIDDLRLLLVQMGRVSRRDKARLLRIPPDTVVDSDATIAVYADMYRQAKANWPVLIRGETGTGKEHLARYFHSVSRPAGTPWVALQVSAIPATLYESELFGHEKGAFTGAEAQKSGAFSQAGNGTLFLDEIGALPPELQAKLLRVLGERTYRRVGGKTDLPVCCSIVAATRDDLEAIGFRDDLLARFRQVVIPPLRERPRELLTMAEHFLSDLQTKHGKRGMVFSDEARQALTRQKFPDNARGLQRAIDYAVATLSSNAVVGAHHLRLVDEGERRSSNGSAQTQAAMPQQSATTSVVPPHPKDEERAPDLRLAIRSLANGSVSTRADDLRGVLAQLDEVTARLGRDLAIAALRACRHPVSLKPKVLPAMQLLLGNDRLTPMQAKRKLNELLGRPQNVALGDELLRDLCEGIEVAPGPATGQSERGSDGGE